MMTKTVRARRARGVVIGLAIAALLAAGSAPAADRGGSPPLAKKQVFVAGWYITDLNPVDPARATTVDTWFLAIATLSGLVRYPPGSIDVTRLEPDLAERWETSRDGLTWTFALRKGVQFQKGFGEFTAEDVKYSYDRFKDPNVKAAYGRPNVKQIDVVDRHTVRFTLKKPAAFFLNDVSNWNGGWIICKKAVEQMGLEAFSRAPVGTGPFQFGAYEPKQSLTLDANPSYFRGRPILDKVVIKFMGPDENVRALGLRNGDLQEARAFYQPELVKALEKDGYQLAGRWGNRWVLHFKLGEKPFDDLRVRKAIAYGIDRRAFGEALGGMSAALYAHLTPPQPFSLTKAEIPEDVRYEYSPDKARKLLAEAGLPNGFSARVVVPNQIFLPTMLVVQDQLKKIGVTLDFEVVDWNKWLSVLRQGTNVVEVWDGLESTPDQALRDYFYSASIVGKTAGVRNWSHYGELVGSVDEKLDEAATKKDAQLQRRLYKEIQLQLLRDLPSLPLHYTARPNSFLAKNVDLGYKFENSLMGDVPITEKTRLLGTR